MTRKQAIKLAISRLQSDSDNQEIIEKLEDILSELPLIHWSDKSIRDTVEQFIVDNGRPPTATDFKRAGMPPHPVIKQKYKITLGEWLEENYPTMRPSFEEIKEKYTKDFLIDYEQIKPRSSYEFNEKRRPSTRGWQTIAFYHNVKSWRALLKALNLQLYFDMARDHVPVEFDVNITTDIDFALEDDNDIIVSGDESKA